MPKLNIPVILGTGREGRRSEPVAKFVYDQAQSYGFGCKFIDVRNYATPFTTKSDDDSIVQKWRKIANDADGFIIVTPEYNHSFPGELKILLDKAYAEYHRKPVGLCAVSSGGLGGARVVEHVLPMFNTYQLVSLKDGVYFSNVEEMIDDSEKIKDEFVEFYTERLKKMFADVEWYANVLKAGRT